VAPATQDATMSTDKIGVGENVFFTSFYRVLVKSGQRLHNIGVVHDVLKEPAGKTFFYVFLQGINKKVFDRRRQKFKFFC
jgi:hypothetical protein